MLLRSTGITSCFVAKEYLLKQVKKGKNKEDVRLPQINLALLFGEESGLPFYYCKLPRHVTDVKTVRQLMQEFHIMGYKKVSVVLDRGFYSKRNVDHPYQNYQKFIIDVKLNFSYVKTHLEEERERLKLWSNLHTQYGNYGICKRIDWTCGQERPHKGDIAEPISCSITTRRKQPWIKQT